MTSPCDVAILGAGPAGSTLAALLAMRGVRVTLVERDTFPRDKLCGEFLSYDALPILDALGALSAIDARGANPITTCRIVGSRRSVSFDLPAAARGISRVALDEILFRRAIELGAVPLEGSTATRIARHENGFAIDLTAHDGTANARLDAKTVVGAWGRWGRMDLQLGRSFTKNRTTRHFGFKRHYRSRASRAASTIELHAFDRGYLGVSSVEGNITNICGLVHDSRLSGHRGGWDAFVDELKRESAPLCDLYEGHDPAGNFLSSEPVIFTAKSPVANGVILIGDAAGLIDPLTGNGMAMGIQSALLAAPFAVALVDNSRPRAQIEHAWSAAYADAFSSRIGWSRRVAFLLSRPQLLETAMAALPGAPAGRLFLRRTRGDVSAIERQVAQWLLAVRNL